MLRQTFSGEGLIAGVYARNLLNTIQREGIASQAYYQLYQLNKNELSDLNYQIPYETYLSLVEDAVESTDIPALGIKVGCMFDPLDLGLVGYATNSCQNLGKAFELEQNFSKLTTPITGKLYIDEDIAYYQFDPRITRNKPKIMRFQIEDVFTEWFNFSQRWGEPIPWFQQIDLAFDQPDYSDYYREFFQCPIKYNQPHNRFYFNKALLQRPFSTYQEHLYQLTEQQCRHLLDEKFHTNNLSGQVQTLLAKNTGHYPSIEQVCEQFHFSPATLRRRLAKEGTSYSQLLKEFRLHLACRYLEETNLPISEIAYLTGYSEPANFTRAFKSIYACSPLSFRQQNTDNT